MSTLAAERKRRPEIYPFMKESQPPLVEKPFESIPGPRILPVVGSLWQYFPGGRFYSVDEVEVIDQYQAEYGNVMREQFAKMTLVRLFNPDDFVTIYFSDLKCPIRPGMGMMAHYNEVYNNKRQGLLTGQGQSWLSLRRQVQSHFMQPAAVATYLPGQDEVAQSLVERLSQNLDSNGHIQDLTPELYKFAIESIVSMCFGMKLGSLERNKAEAEEFIQAVNTVMKITQSEIYAFPWYKILNTPTLKMFVKANALIHKVSTAYSNAAFEKAKTAAPGAVTALRAMISMNEEEFSVFVSDMLFASIDTTGHCLAFVLFHLSKYQDVQEKLYQEIKKAGLDGQSLDLSALPYLRAVLKETLRLKPVTPSVGRVLSKDVLASGYRLQKGTVVSLHHGWAGKQEQYFQKAHEYIPERWLDSNTSKRHPYVFLPFGFGPRSCIGQRVALQEVSLAVIRLLQKYKVDYLSDSLKTVTTIVTTPVNKLPFSFQERE